MHNKYINVFKSSNRKSIFTITLELFKLMVTKKELPVHYFSRLLFLNGHNNIEEYLSLSDLKKIFKNHFNQNSYAYLFEDKIIFNNIMSKLQMPIPKLYGYIASDKLFSGKNIKEFKTIEEIDEILSNICEKSNRDLFLKPVDGMNGTGCFSYSTSSKMSLDNFENIQRSVYVIQEKIQQHKKLSEIYPNSINTLRINTIYNGRKTVYLNSILRFGVNEREVDNGGAFISINGGYLAGPAYSFLEYGGNVYWKHPNTKVELDKFEVPFFKEAVDLVIKCAEVFPSKVIGWDVAITERGPLIIEANHNPHLGMADIAYGGLKKSSLFREHILNN